jgi:hypothetical protein
VKLRLQGNMLRLRLTRSEVDRFHETGSVEEAIQFPDGAGLVWTLESSGMVAAPQASYGSRGIRVLVPASLVHAWATSNEVGIYSADSTSPAISIEKDFQCLHDAVSADAFPNPAAGRLDR